MPKKSFLIYTLIIGSSMVDGGPVYIFGPSEYIMEYIPEVHVNNFLKIVC